MLFDLIATDPWYGAKYVFALASLSLAATAIQRLRKTVSRSVSQKD